MSVVTASDDDVVIEFVLADGAPVRTALADAAATAIVKGMPVRRFGSYAGMRHYPGWWWSSTNKDLVGYESLLERDRLLVADFDPTVECIASQPFGITGQVSGKERRHVPDYLLAGVGVPTVVDVKPARLLDKPEVAEILGWTATVMAHRGWRYEVWTGDEPRLVENLRFLAQGRRPRVDEEALQLLRESGQVGSSLGSVLGEAARRDGTTKMAFRAALLRLLWLQEWVVDLTVPLTQEAIIRQIEEPR